MQNPTENRKGILSVIDWPLLLFIVLAVNVKIYVKIAAIGIYLLYLIFFKKAQLTRKLPGFVKFYLVIIIAGAISSLFSGAFGDSGYWFGFGWGTLQWLCAAGIGYASFLTVKTIPSERIEKTIAAFFILNAIICLASVISIAADVGTFPYWYADAAGQYGVSTGDHIQSVFQNNSITNAAVSMFGALYYLSNKRLWLAFVCMMAGMLSTSNVSLLLFAAMLVVFLIFVNEKKVKVGAILLLLAAGIGYIALTPENFSYMNTVAATLNKESKSVIAAKEEIKLEKEQEKINGVQPVKTEEQIKREKVREGLGNYTILVKDSIAQNVPQAFAALKAFPSQLPGVAFDIAIADNLLNTWYTRPLSETPVYGYEKPLKIYSTKQTIKFLLSDVRHCLLGAGMGNYSSKLAVKMTGLGFEGSYPEKYVYANKDFLQHTFHTLMYVYTQPVSQHSVINTPRNVYNQIAGEYGLLGIALAILFYIGYIVKNRKYVKYGGMILTLFVLLMFGFEYWFEFMSLTVIFELIIMKQIADAERQQ